MNRKERENLRELFRSEDITNHQIAYEICKGMGMEDLGIGMFIINDWKNARRYDNPAGISHTYNLKNFEIKMIFYSVMNCIKLMDINPKSILNGSSYDIKKLYDSRNNQAVEFEELLSRIIKKIFKT